MNTRIAWQCRRLGFSHPAAMRDQQREIEAPAGFGDLPEQSNPSTLQRAERRKNQWPVAGIGQDEIALPTLAAQRANVVDDVRQRASRKIETGHGLRDLRVG